MASSRVVVIGLDGLHPGIVEPLLLSGRLPHLASLCARGGYCRLATTTPAQTPVAWATFATGVNPGGHGIFDFLGRDPETYLPDLALNRYEQASALLPPRVVNRRRGVPVWSTLSSLGIGATVLRCPCTFPPDPVKGRMLSGMGVPDIRGGLGTSTLFTTGPRPEARDSEQVVALRGGPDEFHTRLPGPRNPRTGEDITAEMHIRIARDRGRVIIETDGRPATLELEPGRWSDWLRLRFKRGLLQATAGMVRFLAVRTEPHLDLYVSPVNFDPQAPPFPISHPWDYGAELAREVGLFYTAGIVEDHAGLSNDRFDETAFLAQCDDVLREREAMLQFELDRSDRGLLFCLFDTPDRIQHMFWRFGVPGHPANRGRQDALARYASVIEEHYQKCDAIVGRVLAGLDESTLVIVLSDHGFASFERGVHLNAWLLANGFLQLRAGVEPGAEAGEFLRQVEWSGTRAYAVGLGGIYLNLSGREAEGIVSDADAATVAGDIVRGLTGLADDARSATAVRRVRTRVQLYHGPFAAESPDLTVDFAPGYRASWTTALGGVPPVPFEDNTRKWSGDHIVDPALVPGVLFMSRPFRSENASLLDLAPTILAALDVPAPTQYEGTNLLDPS